ncbi:MAG: glutamine synthetase [Flavobacteriales bacterium]|nr:MAG: glutamine synthetase [Flavobacteriales bacterium]
MTNDEIIAAIKESTHSKIKVAIVDIDGVLRGKYMHKDKFLASLASNFGFCSVVFGWDMVDAAYDNAKITGWHTGYADIEAHIDVSTYRKVPWEDDVPFFLADFRKKDGEHFPVCPRNLLKNVIVEAQELGFSPMFSQEYEWFNFMKSSDEPNEDAVEPNAPPKPLTSGMFGYSMLRASENSAFFHDLFELMGDYGIPLEGLHTETGPGVYEAAIQYAAVLEAADRSVLFKSGVKEIAYKHNVLASFMAKQSSDLPGCGGHIHQSLWDANKKNNLFFDATKADHMSDLMQHYVAGQLHCLPYILPMFAPTINSYKRLVEGAWAPTTLSWGIDNRTTALRILAQGEKSARVEHRVVGSDVNPYLAMAACLASGLYGVKNKLKLNIPKTIGNGYEEENKIKLPSNLFEASEQMKNSKLAKELFGETFVDHFTGTREWEWRQFGKEVTDWELKRYFEII